MTAASGKRLKEKKIGEVVNPRLIQAPPDLTVRQAVELMRENHSSYLVVAEAGRPVGIFTESDVVNKVLVKGADWQRPLRDVMTPRPETLKLEDTVGRAVDLMAENDFYHIPLVNEKQELVNVLSVRTLIRFLAEFYPGEIYNIPPNPHQVMKTPEGG